MGYLPEVMYTRIGNSEVAQAQPSSLSVKNTLENILKASFIDLSLKNGEID